MPISGVTKYSIRQVCSLTSASFGAGDLSGVFAISCLCYMISQHHSTIEPAPRTLFASCDELGDQLSRLRF